MYFLLDTLVLIPVNRSQCGQTCFQVSVILCCEWFETGTQYTRDVPSVSAMDLSHHVGVHVLALRAVTEVWRDGDGLKAKTPNCCSSHLWLHIHVWASRLLVLLHAVRGKIQTIIITGYSVAHVYLSVKYLLEMKFNKTPISNHWMYIYNGLLLAVNQIYVGYHKQP